MKISPKLPSGLSEAHCGMYSVSAICDPETNAMLFRLMDRKLCRYGVFATMVQLECSSMFKAIDADIAGKLMSSMAAVAHPCNTK